MTRYNFIYPMNYYVHQSLEVLAVYICSFDIVDVTMADIGPSGYQNH